MNIRRAQEYDLDFVLQYLSETSYGVHIVEDELGERLGLVEFRDLGDYNLHIDYIVVVPEHRDNHIGTQVIHELMRAYPEHEICGESLPRESSYYFWESLGAEFYMEFDLEDYADRNTCIPFVIH